MNTVGIRNFGLAVVLSFSAASLQPILQAAPAQAGAVNVSKDVMDKKGVIVWHDAPAEAIPGDVCTILQVCGGKTKIIALPAVTEDGQKVTRGLFLTQSADSKHADEVVLLRQTTSDRYFFLVSADGKLQKAAFIQLGSKQWSPIAASLAQPLFEKDVKAWHERVLKLGAAPAAAPAAGN